MRVTEPISEAEFEQYYHLRWQVLRAPWQQPPGTERAPDDESAIHAMLLDAESQAAGVCRLHFESAAEGQLRFMAIREDLQGQGLGKYLMHYLEEKARAAGCKYLTLQARELAVNFYKKHGYKVIKKTHLLFGSIQHYQMEKQL
ncbi:GNAT family N-acetyltransferase [Adhaeribacter sp. BT258]|uniref:GNAT family N-acetyltransferase n=1 Tax=Adhaeribacter terrigena TaxID=2793070 RepID=A0ABS1C5L8_9BACT|nr:GNAT family N-acetyltransferase [Adhaeribacter terrigena]MBK0404482.1 GNAT family N-acetyltransferase [Adhaeribacter terrigena]